MLNIITHHASIASTYTTETFIAYTCTKKKMHPYPQLTQSSAHRGVVTL